MDVHDATFIAAATRTESLPPPMFAEIAFAGRSNVGKSSLINSMARRNKLVRTGSTPGLTRQIQIFRMKLRDAELDFVDLPGYGYAARSKTERASWGPMIEGFLSERAGLRGVLVLVDARRGLEDDDRQLLDFLDSIQIPSFVVATKVDKLGTNERRIQLEALRVEAGRRIIGYSVTANLGRDELWKLVLDACSIVPSAKPAAKPTAKPVGKAPSKPRSKTTTKPASSAPSTAASTVSKAAAKPDVG